MRHLVFKYGRRNIFQNIYLLVNFYSNGSKEKEAVETMVLVSFYFYEFECISVFLALEKVLQFRRGSSGCI